MSKVIKCSNGHEQPQAGSKFCIYCGIAVVMTQPPPGQAAPAPNLPPQHQFPQPPPPNQRGPQYQNQQQYYQQNQYQQYSPQPVGCYTCSGNPANLPDKVVICRECRSLKPLAPGYHVDTSAFAWAADAKAMSVLRSMTPLNMAAKAVSEKVGRRWIETTFNSVLLGEKQMPHIFGQAVRAARILGMSHMPDVYLSGERPWDCLTFGTEKDSFVVVGSALAGNFQGVDMLFLLAREMGHSKAGHALWKTVIRFFLGEQGPAKGFMAGGIFNALSPSALIGGAIEMPLLAWARQAEITADRAGLLTVGSEEVARRVLLSWSLKSSFIYKQINIESWLEQQSVDDDSYSKLSELTTTSTPYIGPRLKLISQFAQSPELQNSLRIISETIKAAAPPPPKPKEDPNTLRFKCSTCGTPMRIPRKALDGKAELPVKCPSAKCGAITRLKKNVKADQGTEARRPNKQENLDYGD
ncbi:MAG: M48 family metallopeptidase [Acidobacteria bacterium]|nr:M48 family metallopeptidase [Acidobacteriota bacterium]